MKQMMRLVVVKGTAKSVAGTTWSLAAKTGTAQIGLDKRRYNKWMIGFGPFERPQVAISIVLRNISDSEDPRAKRVFRAVMEEIAKQKPTDEKEHVTKKQSAKK
jgi:cell division protein FtsI/penicillin-binding protein 2